MSNRLNCVMVKNQCNLCIQSIWLRSIWLIDYVVFSSWFSDVFWRHIAKKKKQLYFDNYSAVAGKKEKKKNPWNLLLWEIDREREREKERIYFYIHGNIDASVFDVKKNKEEPWIKCSWCGIEHFYVSYYILQLNFLFSISLTHFLFFSLFFFSSKFKFNPNHQIALIVSIINSNDKNDRRMNKKQITKKQYQRQNKIKQQRNGPIIRQKKMFAHINGIYHNRNNC